MDCWRGFREPPPTAELRPALPTHVLATVRAEVGAGDPARLVGDEERNGVGDLVRLAQAAGGDLRDDLVAHFLRHGHHHVGADVARGDGVHGDAELRVLLRQRNREAVHAGLGRGVVGLALLPVDRTDLDVAAPLARTHALDDRAGDVEAGVQVGADHLAPLLRRHLVEGGVAGDAGVVDEDLHRAELALDFADHRFGVLGRGDIALGQRDRDAFGGHLRLPGAGLLLVAVVGRHAVPRASQALADRRADATRATRHQRHSRSHVLLLGYVRPV